MKSDEVYLYGIPHASKSWDFLFTDDHCGQLKNSDLMIPVLTIVFLGAYGELPHLWFRNSQNTCELDLVHEVDNVFHTSLKQAESYFRDRTVCERLLSLSESKQLLELSRHLRLACLFSKTSSDLMCAHLFEICMTLIENVLGASTLSQDLSHSHIDLIIEDKDPYTDTSKLLKARMYALAVSQINWKLQYDLCRGSLKGLRAVVNCEDFIARDLIIQNMTYQMEAQLLANLNEARNNLYHVDLNYDSSKILENRNPKGVTQIFMVRELKYWLWQYIQHLLTKNDKTTSRENCDARSK